MAERPLIRHSLLLLDVCGLSPVNQNIFSIFRAAFAMSIALTVTVELLMQIIYNWKGLHSMAGVGFLSAIYQIILKLFMMILSHERLVKLLRKTEQFPPLNFHERDLRCEIEEFYTVAEKYMKIACFGFAFFVLPYFLIPYFLDNESLPFDTYHPTDRSKFSSYHFAYFLQLFAILYECVSIVGFDCLFFSFIVHFVCELKVVRRNLASLPIDPEVEGDDPKCLLRIYQVVDHHSLVLKCIKRLDSIYSVLLLNQFLSSLICMCSGLLSMIANGFPPDMGTFLLYAVYLIAGLAQLFSYCLGGSYLIYETEKVAQAAFETDWWIKTQPKVRKYLALVIQRANRAGTIVAGGMYVLNLQSFSRIVKQALSFFTIVQAMYTREE